MSANSQVKRDSLYKDWVNPDLGFASALPFSLSFSFGCIPTIDVDLGIVKKDLIAFWEKIRGSKLDADRVLTVKEAATRILNNKLQPGEDISVIAFLPSLAPRRITHYPSFSSSETNLSVSIERGAATYCPEVGREFFFGIPCNFIYLVEVEHDQAFFLRTYFPAALVPNEHLRLLNNLGTIVLGKLQRTSLPYPCKRTTEVLKNVELEKFVEKTDIGILADVLYHTREFDFSYVLKDYGVAENSEQFLRWVDDKTQVYWLRRIT